MAALIADHGITRVINSHSRV